MSSYTLDLSGLWNLRLDPEDQGLLQRWFEHALCDINGTINLPGSLQEHGFGEKPCIEMPWTGAIADKSFYTDEVYATYRESDNFKVPFGLTPQRYFQGPAWYEREFVIDEEFLGGRGLRFTFERVHWFSEVWIDGVSLGKREALAVPHVFECGPLSPGIHRILIRVDNRLLIDVGANAHSVSDHTQSNWNGLIGFIGIEPIDAFEFTKFEIYPAVDARSVRLELSAAGLTQGTEIRALIRDSDGEIIGRIRTTLANKLEIKLTKEAPLWDEFSPNLCSIEVEVWLEDTLLYQREESFGFRVIQARERHLLLNGHRLFLRGTLDCCVYPQTGYPPTDRFEWMRIFSQILAHGLNHVRFHSWCPPEAAFYVADELGLYLQVECGTWTEVGSGSDVDSWIAREAERIISSYGNHPSFCILTHGNEPMGAEQKEYLGNLQKEWRLRDTRRLYTSGAGWPEIEENDFHISPGPRIHGWTSERRSRINALPPETMSDYRYYTGLHEKPVVSHEIGQWCVFPNLEERQHYTGVLKPGQYDIVADRLRARNMSDLAAAFLQSSGKLQALVYKEEIEAALRTGDMGGFQLLGLSDFPGQGTAPVGVLDAFWSEKGYVQPAEFRRFCSATVPLVRLHKRVFTQSERLGFSVEIAHYGPKDLNGVSVEWALRDEMGTAVKSGDWHDVTIKLGRLSPIGDVVVDLHDLAVPARYRLEVTIPSVRGANDWDVWIYSDLSPISAPGVLVHDRLDKVSLSALERGDTVILSPSENGVLPDSVLGEIKLGFSPIFWNTAWTGRQGPHTLGILCEPTHPALAQFPTEFHSNWQWWYLLSRSQVLLMDELPSELSPLIRVIDDWATCRNLALAFEARIGNGRLIATGMELRFGYESNPVVRQMLSSLLAYAQSEAFNPSVALTLEQLHKVYPKLGAFDPL